MSQGRQPPKREGGNAQRRPSTAGPARADVPSLVPLCWGQRRVAGWGESGGDEGSVGSGLVPLGATGNTGAWGTEWAWIYRGWLGSKSWGQVHSLILHPERVMAGWMCPGGSTQAEILGTCSLNTRSWRGLKWGSGSWGLHWIMIL